MKKNRIICGILALIIAASIAFCFAGCTSDNDGCFICGGSGYYQKKDCPGC